MDTAHAERGVGVAEDAVVDLGGDHVVEFEFAVARDDRTRQVALLPLDNLGGVLGFQVRFRAFDEAREDGILGLDRVDRLGVLAFELVPDIDGLPERVLPLAELRSPINSMNFLGWPRNPASQRMPASNVFQPADIWP